MPSGIYYKVENLVKIRWIYFFRSFKITKLVKRCLYVYVKWNTYSKFYKYTWQWTKIWMLLKLCYFSSFSVRIESVKNREEELEYSSSDTKTLLNDIHLSFLDIWTKMKKNVDLYVEKVAKFLTLFSPGLGGGCFLEN